MSADPSHPLVDLTGQVALVTGGGRGLGRAFAIALAKAGARVAVTARTAEPLAQTVAMVERAGGRALAIPGDVSAPDAVAHVVRTAESQLGMVDILVNNAGAVGPLGYDWEVDLEDWWRTFEINVRAPEGSTLAATSALAERIATDVRTLPGVTDTLTTIGGGQQELVNNASIYVKLTPIEERKVSQQ